MNFYSKTLFFTIIFFSITTLHAKEQIKPAGNMQVCALQGTEAFATDYFGNMLFCAQGSCRKIMDRPGKAVPQQLECANENNVAYVIYSNNKLYRCTSDNYLPNKKRTGCVLQVMKK